MTDVTYAELKERTARKLGILADTASLSAEDGDLIGNALLDIQAQAAVLFQMSFLDVENGTARELAEPLAQIAAAHLTDEYGIGEPRRSQLRAEGLLGIPGRSPAERRLRELMSQPTHKMYSKADVTYV